MTDVIMPQMGESIAEGTLTRWMKNVGDRVERDEPLFEISTDKVDAEIPSPAAGILAEIKVQPGTTVPINTVVGVIGSADAATVAAPAMAPAATDTEKTLISVPAVSVPPLAPAPPPAPAAVSATRAPGMPAAAPAPAPPPLPATPAAAPAPPPRAEMSVEELRRTRSSPVVRKIASEHGVDISAIPGTGLSGRVTKSDILTHLETRGVAGAVAAVASADTLPPIVTDKTLPPRPAAEWAEPATGIPAYRPGERVEIVPMSPIRRKTAEHMTASKRISAHVSTVWEVDMTRVDQLRRKHQALYLERHGIKLTFMPFVIKATIDALKANPVLNASVEGENVVYKKDINLGIAVALDWGLIVPVIRGAGEKNLLGLARAIGDLAERARAKKLKVEEIQGGTFTITNPGVFGSLFGTPIINQPQVAILGVGTIEKRPVVRDDAIAIRSMTYLALTFDHRIVDGADADRFMAQVKKSLEQFDEGSL